jgi:hypothetical protein
MTWLTVIGSTFYYLLLPLTTVFGWLLVLLAPVLHLGSYILSGILLPLSLLAKFEVYPPFAHVLTRSSADVVDSLHLSWSCCVNWPHNWINLTLVFSSPRIDFQFDPYHRRDRSIRRIGTGRSRAEEA